MNDFLFFYFVPLLLFLWIYLKKFKKLTPGLIIVLVCITSSICSIYLLSFWKDHYLKISILPFIFQFVCLMIVFRPIIKFDYKLRGLNKFSSPSYLNEYAVYFFIIISVLPFIENVHHILFGSVLNSSNIADIYESKQEANIVDWLDPVSKVFNTILQLFFIYIIHLFFLNLKDRKKIKIILLLLPMVNNFIIAMNTSSRAFMMGQILIFGYAFLVYRRFLVPNVLVLCKKIFAFISIIFLSFFIFITIARFNNTVKSDITVVEYISIYAGEGIINFNNELWRTKAYSKGDTNFSLFKELLGLPTFDKVADRRAYWEPKTNIRTNVFYTSIGDIFFDFGPIGCILFFLIISFLLNRFLVKRNFGFEEIFIFSFLPYFIIYGITCNPFKTYWQNLVLVINIILYFILKYNLNEKSRKGDRNLPASISSYSRK